MSLLLKQTKFYEQHYYSKPDSKNGIGLFASHFVRTVSLVGLFPPCNNNT